ncbi:MAG: hypothetical protein QF731_01865 [Verrucomicrobiota bacterium]|nr:hypothetical protein [Verrucomicrobiota bacterium]
MRVVEEPDHNNQYEVRGDDGNIYGPESDATIRRWCFEKRLNAQSVIRRVGETDWRPVSTYEEFKIPTSATNVPFSPPVKPPGVIFWYRIYCAFTGVFFGLLVILFLYLISIPGMEENMSASEYVEFQITSIIMIAVGIPCVIFYFACAFMTHRGWHWILGLVSIGLGMTGCCLPACIPLLIFWIKPETKSWLNRNE